MICHRISSPLSQVTLSSTVWDTIIPISQRGKPRSERLYGFLTSPLPTPVGALFTPVIWIISQTCLVSLCVSGSARRSLPLLFCPPNCPVSSILWECTQTSLPLRSLPGCSQVINHSILSALSDLPANEACPWLIWPLSGPGATWWLGWCFFLFESTVCPGPGQPRLGNHLH